MTCKFDPVRKSNFHKRVISSQAHEVKTCLNDSLIRSSFEILSESCRPDSPFAWDRRDG